MNPDWIEYKVDVPSSKPVIGAAVLVYSPIEGMGIAALEERYSREEWCWLYRRVNDSMLAHSVTHWMRLPGAPEGKVR